MADSAQERGFVAGSYGILELQSVLMNDPNTKTAFALCRHRTSGESAIVTIGKQSFTEDEIRDIVEEHADVPVDVLTRNGKYGTYLVHSPGIISARSIFPASNADISKYTKRKQFLFRETKSIYNTITEPYITSIPESHNQWILNIFNHTSEVDRILYENERFVLLLNAHCDGKDPLSCYCLAIVKDLAIRSVRDLTDQHIDLLTNMQSICIQHICRKYPEVCQDDLRVYVHYHPSFWQFHVHFSVVSHPQFGLNFSVGKAIVLDDVIDNLQMNSQYYANASISITVPDQTPLHQQLFQAGLIGKIKASDQS